VEIFTEYIDDDQLVVCSADEVILPVYRRLCSVKSSRAVKEGFVTLLSSVRLEFCSKKALDELSVDKTVLLYLRRNKLLEHLQYIRHSRGS
jgi:hypothetical protein